MGKCKKIIFLILLPLVFGCGSDDYYSGVAEFELNNEKYDFSIRATSVDNGFSIIFDGISKSIDRNVCSINIFNIPEDEGKYRILNEPRSSGLTSGFLSFVEQDVTLELYELNDSDQIDDFIEITDKRGRNIEGVVNLSFKNFTNYQPQSPDSIIINSGSFSCRIER